MSDGGLDFSGLCKKAGKKWLVHVFAPVPTSSRTCLMPHMSDVLVSSQQIGLLGAGGLHLQAVPSGEPWRGKGLFRLASSMIHVCVCVNVYVLMQMCVCVCAEG